MSKGRAVTLTDRIRAKEHGGSASVRVPELAVGLFIVAASIGGALLWQRSVESGTSVLVLTRDVRRGDVLSRTDLSQVILTTTGNIALIRAAAVDQVIGRRVTVDVLRDTPLTPAILTQTAILGPLEGLVGFTVSVATAPVELAAGDSVRVFTAAPSVDGGLVVQEVPGPIRIWNVSTPDPLSSERAITVQSPAESIPSFVAAEKIHLVKVEE